MLLRANHGPHASGSQLNTLAASIRLMYRQGEMGGVYLPYNPDLVMPRRNLLLWSEQASNATYWTKSTAVPVITSAADYTPLGGTADLWTRTSTASSWSSQNIIKQSPDGFFTASFSVKKSVGNYFAIRLQTGYPSRADVVFNLSTGTISSAAASSSGFSNASATITSEGNGYYRVSLTARPDGLSVSVFYSFNTGGGVLDATDTVANSAGYVSCAQLELGSVATPYQKVTDWYTEFMGGAPLVRRNLSTYTEDIYQSSWGKTSVSIISNATGAPDGNLTADKIVSAATTGRISVSLPTTVPTGTPSVGSIYLKKAEWNFATVFVDTATISEGAYWGVGYRIDLTTGAITGGGGGTIRVEDAGNGWWRFSITCTITSGPFKLTICPKSTAAMDVNAIAGDGVSGIYVWGGQVESGSIASPYQAITDWTTEYNADTDRRLAQLSKITMWQDNIGSLPVTKVEDSIGMWLDISQRYSRLGPSLVTNGTFDSDVSGWTTQNANAPVWSTGTMSVTTTASSGGVYQDVTVVAGKKYLVTAQWTAAPTASLRVFDGGNFTVSLAQTADVAGSTVQRVTVTPTATTIRVYLRNTSNATQTFDNVSVREVQTDSLPTGRGPELWNDASVTFGTSSSRVSAGVYRVYSPTGAETGDVNILNAGVTGQWYEIVFNVDSVTAAGSGLRVGASGGSGPVVAATIGPKRAIAQSDGTALIIKRSSGITDVQISNVSYRAIPGNHATQATPGARGKLTARVNRFYKSQDLSAVAGFGAATQTTPWERSATGVNVPVLGVLAPDDSLSGASVTVTANFHALRQAITVIPGEQLKVVWHSKDATFAPKYSIYNITAAAQIVGPLAYPAGQSVANGWTQYSTTVTVPAGCTSLAFYPLADSGASGSISLWGADVRTADDAAKNIPVYQRVNTSTDYDTIGFPHGVQTDGGDDRWMTNSFSGSGSHHTLMAAFKHLGGGAAYGSVINWGVTPALVNIQRNDVTVNGSARVDTSASSNQTSAITNAFDGGTHVVRFTVDSTQRRTQTDSGAEASLTLTGSADYVDSGVLSIGGLSYVNTIIYGAMYLRSSLTPASFELLRRQLAKLAGI